jgi:serine/threonine protein kinase/tetratricopeptide (TPR) repeat protein
VSESATIGPFVIQGSLGEGGMGVVYRAVRRGDGRAAAVKTVSAATAAWLASIRREIHALSRLRHPGIVRVFDQGVDNGRPWYAMELLQGETFRAYHERLWGHGMGPRSRASGVPSVAPTTASALGGDATEVVAPSDLAWAEAQPASFGPEGADSFGSFGDLAPVSADNTPVAAGELTATVRLLRRLCETLAYLHGEGIVHGDLKPDNVFVLPDGTPVLVDFGLASSARGGVGREALTTARGVTGTWAYMAPEQIRGEPLDPRTDLYALGCMMYELVAGRLPFPGGAREILWQHLTGKPRPLGEVVTGVPPLLESIVMRLLAKAVHERVGYAEDVARALAELSGEREPLAGYPTPRAYLYRPALAGRDELLGQVTDHVRELRGGRGAFVLVRGESGVGKTRFALEAMRAAEQLDVTVVTGECSPGAPSAYGGVRSAPLHPFAPLLQVVADRCQAGGLSVTDELLGPNGAVLALYEPSIAAAPGVAQQPPPMPLPPEASRRRLFASMCDVLVRLSLRGPLMLILDDLQWADDLTAELLGSLEASLFDRPIFVLGAYRSEETTDALRTIGARPFVETVALGRLDEDAVRAMVRDMLSFPSPPPRFVGFLARHTEGNPFFVAEYLRAAVGVGLIRRDPLGAWEIDAGPDAVAAYEALPLPGSLRELVEQRLRGLDEAARLLVETASVLGRDFEGELLLESAGAAEADGLEAVTQLIGRQVLEQGEQGQLRFLHDKLREVAYEAIPDWRRRAMHLRVAELLELRSASRADFARAWPRLGAHFAAAREHARASHYLALAADHARARHANGEAIALFQSAIDQAVIAAETTPAEAARFREQSAELEERMGDVLALTGQREPARRAYGRAVELAESQDPIARARLLRKTGKAFETEHDHRRALELYEAAQSALGEAPPGAARAAAWREEWVQVRIDQVWLFYWLDRLPEMSALVEALEPVVAKEGAPAQRSKFFQGQLQRSFRRERYVLSKEAVGYGSAALEAALAAGDLAEIPMAHFNYGFALLFHGDFEGAERELGASLELAERAGDAALRTRCLTYLTVVSRERGRVEETRDRTARSLAAAEAAKLKDYVATARANQAWLAVADGEFATAEERANEALSLWRGLSLVFPMQWLANVPLAEVLMAAGRTDEAVGCAAALLEPTQMKLPEDIAAPLAAAVEAGRAGDLEAARGALEEALDILRGRSHLSQD